MLAPGLQSPLSSNNHVKKNRQDRVIGRFGGAPFI